MVPVWVALQEKVMSGRSRYGSFFAKGSPTLWFLDLFFQLYSSPVFIL